MGAAALAGRDIGQRSAVAGLTTGEMKRDGQTAEISLQVKRETLNSRAPTRASLAYLGRSYPARSLDVVRPHRHRAVRHGFTHAMCKLFADAA